MLKKIYSRTTGWNQYSGISSWSEEMIILKLSESSAGVLQFLAMIGTLAIELLGSISNQRWFVTCENSKNSGPPILCTKSYKR